MPRTERRARMSARSCPPPWSAPHACPRMSRPSRQRRCSSRSPAWRSTPERTRAIEGRGFRNALSRENARARARAKRARARRRPGRIAVEDITTRSRRWRKGRNSVRERTCGAGTRGPQSRQLSNRYPLAGVKRIWLVLRVRYHKRIIKRCAGEMAPIWRDDRDDERDRHDA